MLELTTLEVVLFVALFAMERISPARRFPIAKRWYEYWAGIQLFAMVWLFGLLTVWSHIPAPWHPMQNWSLAEEVIVSYLVYSFAAYWYHRIRHTSALLWRYVHYMHHAPGHMETLVAFWRHPVELIMDSLFVLMIGKSLGMTEEAVLCLLIVESLFEIYHHSNLRTPHWLYWLGYVVQVPEQHLIHHQRNLHRWNYGTVTLWDTLFRTVRLPTEWEGQLGVAASNNVRRLLLFQY